MQPIYEFLYSKDLIKSSEPNAEQIISLTKSQIFGYIEEIINIGRSDELTREKSIFAQSASHALGGGVDECCALDCRINKIKKLTRYSLLYTDKVYIDNFFIRYKHYKNVSRTEIQESFYDDLVLMVSLHPFVERGFIKIFTPKTDVCPRCLSYHDSEMFLTDEQQQRLHDITTPSPKKAEVNGLL